MNILPFLTYSAAMAPYTGDRIGAIILVLCISGLALIVLLIMTLIRNKNIKK